MPTATMSAVVRSAFASAPAATWRVFDQISSGSCSTQPAFGKICSCSFWSTETTRPEWSKIMHLVEVVPWSIAATYWVMRSVLSWSDREYQVEQGCQRTADERADDRDPGVAPVRVGLALDGHQERVGDAGSEVAGGVDGVARRAAERGADHQDDERDTGVAERGVAQLGQTALGHLRAGAE